MKALAARKPIRASSEYPTLTRAEFRQLAEFRYQLLRFLHFSQEAAEEVGLRPQQHQLLLAVQGMPAEVDPSIANVAARLLLKHNSAVELVDRTIEQGFLRRTPDPTDHRRILLRLTPEGERLLRSLAGYHLVELEETAPELIRALGRVTDSKPSVASKHAASKQVAAAAAHVRGNC